MCQFKHDHSLPPGLYHLRHLHDAASTQVMGHGLMGLHFDVLYSLVIQPILLDVKLAVLMVLVLFE